MEKVDYNTVKKFISDKGYGSGSNYTTETVIDLIGSFCKEYQIAKPEKWVKLSYGIPISKSGYCWVRYNKKDKHPKLWSREKLLRHYDCDIDNEFEWQAIKLPEGD